jgi:hypothetical protein
MPPSGDRPDARPPFAKAVAIEPADPRRLDLFESAPRLPNVAAKAAARNAWLSAGVPVIPCGADKLPVVPRARTAERGPSHSRKPKPPGNYARLATPCRA